MIRGVDPEGNDEDTIRPLVMWRSSVICSSLGLDSNDLKSGVGRPSNASLVGAKTVIGPGRERMSTRSANLSMETNIEKSGL